MPGKKPQLIACHDCDLLQYEIPLKKGCTASCVRCGAVLYRNATDSIERTLAFAMAASVLFIIANCAPIFAIEAGAEGSSITLLGAVLSMWDQDMKPISVVVFTTAILVPAIELASLEYLLLPLKFDRLPLGYTFLMRTLRYAEPWGMIEVFMLGILVSLVKLTSNFRVIPGIALWSFGALTLLLAAAAASFSPRDVWARIDKAKQSEAKR